MDTVARGEKVEAELDRLIELRSRRAGESEANEVERAWKESEQRFRQRRRREIRAAWFTHFSRLADSLRRSAEEYEARALALLEEDGSS